MTIMGDLTFSASSMCRGYLAFANSPLIKNNDALAFIPYVPSAMRSIVAGITGALEAVSWLQRLAC